MKKLNQKGFGAVETLLVLLIVGILGGAGWYIYQAQQKTKQTLNNTTQGAGESQKSTKPAAQPKDETANWTIFISEKGKFSLKYPPNWVQPTNKERCNPGLFDRSLYLGPDSNSVLVCGSEYFGQMWVGSVDGDKRADYSFGSGYNNVINKDIVVNDVAGQRISGVAKAKSEDDVFAPLEGTIEVHYVFYTNGITYSARYTQVPKGHNPSTDVLADFDLMITKTLQFK
jgi:type II secretory pathway pseudopilin PulG